MSGWLDQAPENLRGNEAFTGYADKPIGDFLTAHLELKGNNVALDGKVKELDGKVTDLTGKLTNSLPKLTDKSTDAEKANFYKALGVPEKPTDYELPKVEGIENNPKMVAWFQETAHAAHLSKEAAAYIGGQWNSFIKEFNEELVRQEQESLATEMAALDKELGADAEKMKELGKRFFKKIVEADFDPNKHVNLPTLLRFLIKGASLMGEDWSPKGQVKLGGSEKEGMVYDKSPSMPNPSTL